MVTGIEPSIICSYTYESRSIADTERAHMQTIVGAFACRGIAAYSVILDPDTAHLSSPADHLRKEIEVAGRSDAMLAIVVGKHNDAQLALQAGAVIARGGSLVVAYHDSVYGQSPTLETLATDVIAWDRIRDLTDAIKTRVCDNIANDCNTFWPSQRKTA